MTALCLVYSTSEYCALVRHRSAQTRLIDSSLNDVMRIVNGCLRPTPMDYLPILEDIQPSKLRQQEATLSQVDGPQHLLHQLVVWPTTVHEERL